MSRKPCVVLTTAKASFEACSCAYRPLPTMELYDPAAPQRGLLALLKHALWHTLWVDNGPPSGAKLQSCCMSASFLCHW